MSKIKIQGNSSGTGVLTLEAPNTATDRTITLPDSTGTLLDTTSGLDATKLSGTLPALNGASLTGIAGRKNMIINGAMNVAQRGTQSLSSDAYTACDRFSYDITGSYAATYNTTQDSSGTDGFSNSLKFDVTTADTPATDEFGRILYRIEAQDLQHLKYGTSSAQSITLSFWVKSNKTATYAISIYVSDGTRIIGSTYTISSADTWEYKTVTFAGDTAGTIDNNNDTGMQFSFVLDSGSNWTSADNSSWGAYSAGKNAYGHTATVGRSTSDYFQITGVQLELGSTATDFEHRSYGEELALCQRYYQILVDGGADKAIGVGFYWSSNEVDYTHRFVTDMRASPTLEQVTGTDYYRMSAGNDSFNGFSGIQYTSTRSCNMYASSNVSGTAGFASDIRSRNAESFIAFTAEL